MKKPRLQFRSTVEMLNTWNAGMPRLMGYDECNAKDDFKSWQARARRQLRKLLGFWPATVDSPQGWLLSSEETEHFTREQWAAESPFGDHMFFYRLVPRADTAPKGLMLALHGHGYYGADPVAGVMRDRPGEAEHLKTANYAYGAGFAERGWLVYAPTQRGFGLRCDHDNYATCEAMNTPKNPPPPGCSCVDINARAIMLGTTDIGLRVQEAMHLISWIRSRPGERTLPLGCVGLSGGGHATELLTALDTRIKAASIQGYFCYWSEQVFEHTHCNCNYVPGLLRYFEQDDVCGLICPRPLLVTTADNDGVAPLAGFRRAYRALKGIYRDQGAADNLEQDVFSGGHEFSGRKAYDFFDKHLATGKKRAKAPEFTA